MRTDQSKRITEAEEVVLIREKAFSFENWQQ